MVTTASPKQPWKTARRKATSDGQHSPDQRRPHHGPGRDGPAPLRDRRFGRRRQVHPHRAAAPRLQVDLRGPARGGGVDEPVQGLRLHRPGAADRRPALGARAGHHHRRGLPLLRDAGPQVHHRGHPWPHPVHPQHGDWRLDRRPGPRPRRRPAGPHRAVASPRGAALAAAGPAPRSRHQQDGPRRLVAGGVREDPQGVHDLRDQAQHPRPRGHPDLGAAGRQRGEPVREHPVVLRSDADAPPRARPRRLRPRPGRHPLPGPVRDPSQVRPVPRLPWLRRTGGRWRAEEGRRGRRAAVRHDLDDLARGAVRHRDRRGIPAHVGHRPPRGRRRRLPWRHDRSRQELPEAVAGHRRDGLLDDQRAPPAAAEARHQAHHPHGPRDGEGHPVPPGRELAPPRPGGRRARAQRDRPRPAPHHRAAAVRPLLEEPHHGLVHPDRRGDRRHRRRRHDQQRQLMAGGGGEIRELRHALGNVYLLTINAMLQMPGHAFRLWVLRVFASWSIGPETSIGRGCTITRRGGVKVGHTCNINRGVLLDGRGGLTIGDQVEIATGVKVLTASHDAASDEFDFVTAAVRIESRVWLATDALVLPGVVLGAGSVAAARAVVSSDVQPLQIVGGVPARVIGQRPAGAQCKLRPHRKFGH
ncbi:putative transferase [metagenome]|uniref:Putative transferase n=1 Tax=metagenome TaxID=256318 RepID=A0A2P2C6K5_9ZZZZ